MRLLFLLGGDSLILERKRKSSKSSKSSKSGKSGKNGSGGECLHAVKKREREEDTKKNQGKYLKRGEIL